MDRLAALLEQLPLPEITRLLRRTTLLACGVGLLVVVVAFALSHPFIGIGGAIGLSLGLANIRLITSSVARLNERQPAHPKRVLASHTLVRLGITTAVVIGLMFASSQLGLSAAAGLAIFYLLLVVNLLVSLLRGAQASV
jgi:hypothetical protein